MVVCPYDKTPAYRSAWAGGSAVLIRCYERVVVATEASRFVVLVVDVRGRAGFATPAPPV